MFICKCSGLSEDLGEEAFETDVNGRGSLYNLKAEWTAEVTWGKLWDHWIEHEKGSILLQMWYFLVTTNWIIQFELEGIL